MWIVLEEPRYLDPSSNHHHHIFDMHASTKATSVSVGSLPGSWLAARMADFTPDLQVFEKKIYNIMPPDLVL